MFRVLLGPRLYPFFDARKATKEANSPMLRKSARTAGRALEEDKFLGADLRDTNFNGANISDAITGASLMGISRGNYDEIEPLNRWLT